MRKGETLSATARAERSREMTKRMAARELMYAGILARLWPAYLVKPKRENLDYPLLLCVESPAGRITWRLGPDEAMFFDGWLQERKNTGEKALDRSGVLMALAEGWETA